MSRHARPVPASALPPRRAGRRGASVLTAAVVVLVALVCTAGLVVLFGSGDQVGARAKASAGPGSSAAGDARTPCPRPVSVPVAVGDEDVELVRALGEAWRSSSPTLSCVELNLVTPGGTGADPGVRPVAVVSRSPDLAAAPVVGAQGDPVPVASTVVVLALQPDLARGLGWPGEAVTPQDVLALSTSPAAAEAGGLSLSDPSVSATAMLGLIPLVAAPLNVAPAQFTGALALDPQVQGALFSLFNATVLVTGTQSALVTEVTEGRAGGITVLDEAAVARINALGPQNARAPVYPAGAATAMTITMSVVEAAAGAASPDAAGATLPDGATVEEAAADLVAFAASEAGQAVVTASGYRTPEGDLGAESIAALAAGAPGEVIAGQEDPVAALGGEALVPLTFGWRSAANPGRYILVMDVSGSMADEVPGTGRTKLEFAQQAAIQAVQQAPRSGEIGLWEFSTAIDGPNDYRELVANGLVTDVIDTRTRRDALVAAVQGLVPRADTGLYDSTLAAFRRAQQDYRPGEPNLIVLVTDGRNDDTQSIDLPSLLSVLRDEQDPGRPIGITTIAYGEDADVTSLAGIAEATGGLAYVSPNPADIGRVLVAAFSGGRAGLLPTASGPAVPGN